MSKTAFQRIGLFLTFLFALACCASTSPGVAPAQEANASVSGGKSLQLRVAFNADTKGNYEPCPT